MITDESEMPALHLAQLSCFISFAKNKLTPFMMGINEAGSVDIEASSRNTTGKSTTRIV